MNEILKEIHRQKEMTDDEKLKQKLKLQEDIKILFK